MKVSEKYKDIQDLAPFKVLKETGLPLLKESIETFLNCKVSFVLDPVDHASNAFGLKLWSASGSGCFIIDDDTFFIYARILEGNELVSGIGIILRGKAIVAYRGTIQVMEKIISEKLSSSYLNLFADCSGLFGEEILTQTIAHYAAKEEVDYQVFQHLLLFFQKLRSTTFEGRPFSTGLVVTRYPYKNNKNSSSKKLKGIVPLAIKKDIKSTLEVDRRFWYLVDGKHTYFVTNPDLEIKHMLVLEPAYQEQEYVDSNALSFALKGGEVLFRIENEKQFSIVCSDGIEFVYLENRWRIRDYNIIKSYLRTVIKNELVVNRLLYFALYCSRRGISAVIWIPEDMNTIRDYVKPESLHTLVYEPIPICDSKYASQILRFISSDGAAVIDADGLLQYFGCIVNTSKLHVTEIKGTGEAAAQVLSQNGLSIKISRDGTIKLYLPGEERPVLI